jgi:hypothetical protein
VVFGNESLKGTEMGIPSSYQDRSIYDLVRDAFGGLQQDKTSIVQSYITIVMQKIEQLEATVLRSSITILVSMLVFFFITNQSLSEIEVGGVKIEQMQDLVPFFPPYLGYLFYALCSSFANAFTLEQVAKYAYREIAPGIKDSPLETIFMIKPIMGSENHDFTKGVKIERISNGIMVIVILGFLFIFSAVSMTIVCYTTIVSENITPLFKIASVALGVLLLARSYVYIVAHLNRVTDE